MNSTHSQRARRAQDFLPDAPDETFAQASRQTYPFVLPPLPYALDALSPVISRRTLEFHHGKHHKTYIETLNQAIEESEDSDYRSMPLDDIVRASAGKPDQLKIYNNAAQAWNHSFFWHCLKPQGGGEPPAALKHMIGASFGSVNACKQALAEAAISQFGTGWAWLVQDGSAIRAIKTADADSPLTVYMKPLLTIDVWEHAYYLDYQNRRQDYVAAVIDKLLDWEFASANLA
jgi:Fe-Mn family superoxide dismutase